MAGRPTVGVLALQGGVREHVEMLERLGADTRRVRLASDLDGLDGLVIPGGESTVIDKLARTFGLVGPLRERIAGGLPVFGTCAGLILLADRVVDGIDGQETFGGLDVTVARNAFGGQNESFDVALHVRGIDGGALDASFIRAPVVVEHGSEVEVLATLADGHVVAVRQGALLGTAFHPEVTGDNRLHAQFLAEL